MSITIEQLVWDDPDTIIKAHDFHITKVNDVYVVLRRQGDVITTIGGIDTLNAAVEVMMREYAS